MFIFRKWQKALDSRGIEPRTTPNLRQLQMNHCNGNRLIVNEFSTIQACLYHQGSITHPDISSVNWLIYFKYSFTKHLVLVGCTVHL
ncbi:hypothetical protein PDE_07597 [Penicillium oxalicum 114-2]|uniref:Uncharacterized protein n=1 Tax=Penicillium oxalicum (strain 114-2 / CGMCC 5302) TaxID=933388 RepID=S8BCG7_PENO1|nr:hypothetical protein PDE_07597 [Penicillium oxalicum 114-2]